ncbi:MAG: CDP-diacylglycerol--glycerol-3-phosphate 3-phosphatidyltransferase [Desulfobacteraceae bacterium]|nr:MAG: CDP-diacylglycerol--glycerol-3-phosphate 3-phosphatidyltransferase [Desulfobacteraceae bacterium]
MFQGIKIREDLSHPNSLTLYRILVIPVIVLLLIFPNRFSTFIAGIVFSSAAVTDYFDGFYARRRGLVSAFGKLMDPIADKLLTCSAFIMLVAHGWVPGWIVCIIVAREIAVTGLRGVVSEKGGDISASKLGKYKTGFQIAAAIPLILHYPYFGVDLHAVGTFLLWGALIFTVWSGADYFIHFKKLLQH